MAAAKLNKYLASSCMTKISNLQVHYSVFGLHDAGRLENSGMMERGYDKRCWPRVGQIVVAYVSIAVSYPYCVPKYIIHRRMLHTIYGKLPKLCALDMSHQRLLHTSYVQLPIKCATIYLTDPRAPFHGKWTRD